MPTLKELITALLAIAEEDTLNKEIRLFGELFSCTSRCIGSLDTNDKGKILQVSTDSDGYIRIEIESKIELHI
jgi:hypothetical protein